MRAGLVLAAGVATIGAACATYTDKNLEMREALDRGEAELALSEANAVIRANDDRLPSKWKKNTALGVLERATVLQALGRYEDSARDFQAADAELELLDIARDAGGAVAEWMFSASARKYSIPPTERLTLNAMNMINYLARGDLDGARAALELANRYTPREPENLSHLGAVYARLGLMDQARSRYEEALRVIDEQSAHHRKVAAGVRDALRALDAPAQAQEQQPQQERR